MGDDPVNDLMAKFCQALGYFIYSYVQAESHLKRVAIHKTGVQENIGRALYASARVKPIIDTLRRIQEGLEVKNHVRLQEAFAQFATITEMRDKLMHQGFHVKQDLTIETTNGYISNANNRKTFLVSIDDLQLMSSDLALIQARFSVYGMPPPSGPDEAVKAYLDALEPTLSAPFRYKFPSPK